MKSEHWKSGLLTRLQSASADIGTNDILDHYSTKGAVLNIRILPVEGNEEGVPSVLIEGDVGSFVFLADLLLAQIQDSDCGSGISPNGPGSIFFNPKSEYGIYIHVLP